MTRTWDPNGERLFTEGANSTIYQFGYLHRAGDLCYWQREYIQATNAIAGTNNAPPGCGYKLLCAEFAVFGAQRLVV